MVGHNWILNMIQDTFSIDYFCKIFSERSRKLINDWQNYWQGSGWCQWWRMPGDCGGNYTNTQISYQVNTITVTHPDIDFPMVTLHPGPGHTLARGKRTLYEPPLKCTSYSLAPAGAQETLMCFRSFVRSSGSNLSRAVQSIFILIGQRSIRALRGRSENTQRTFREESESNQSIKIRVIQSEPISTSSCLDCFKENTLIYMYVIPIPGRDSTNVLVFECSLSFWL